MNGHRSDTAKVRIEGTRLFLTGELVRGHVPEFSKKISRVDVSRLSVVDLSGVSRIDSSGLGLLEALRDGVFGAPLELQGANEHVQGMLEVFAGEEIPSPTSVRYRFRLLDVFHVFVYIGRIFADVISLSGEIFYWSVINVFRPAGHKKGEVVEQINTIGLNALPITATLSFIIGLILALQGAVQLERFGGGPFLANLMGLAMVREMGPLLMAIILTGRTGSAIASELGTMKVTDEIDALRAMGIRPIEYVVAPKFIAFTIVAPLLAVFSAAVGILGGLLVSVTFAGQPATFFLNRVIAILRPEDGFFLLLKGLLFGWAIVMVSCYCGFEVQGGAIEVGRATTQAVVASIFTTVVLNVVFSIWYLV
ncbi:MAG: ABC transporter permease [Spirochaetales bacterium]